MVSKSAIAPTSLLDELQSTLAHGTVARRVETLRRVTDLFINGAVDYSDEQVGLFDDVFQCLIDHIETSAKTLLANRLAPIDTAPPLTIRALGPPGADEPLVDRRPERRGHQERRRRLVHDRVRQGARRRRAAALTSNLVITTSQAGDGTHDAVQQVTLTGVTSGSFSLDYTYDVQPLGLATDPNAVGTLSARHVLLRRHGDDRHGRDAPVGRGAHDDR